MLASVLVAALLADSCASHQAGPPDPAGSPVPTPGPQADAEPPQAGPGTAIQISAAPKASRAQGDRAAIEEAIVLGSPASLQRARSLLSSSSNLKPEESSALGLAINAFDALIYGSADAATLLAVGVPPGMGGVSALIAKTAVDAFAGRVDDAPPDYGASGLAELLPALAMFASPSRDTARQAQDALERFSGLGYASVIPDLALGLDAERRLDWKAALARYTEALDLAEDAWPARLGVARSELALGQAVEALAILGPLADRLSGSSAFIRTYAEALYENARFAQADQYVARVLVDDPQNSRFILIRAHILVRSGSYQQAVPLLDAYATVDSSNRLFLLLRSQVAEGMRDRDDALRWARRGLAAYADDPELLVTAARLRFSGPSAGRQEARSLAARAYELTPPAQGSEGFAPVQLEARNAAAFDAARLLAADAAARFEWLPAAQYLERATSYGSFEDRALASTILRRSGRAAAALEYADSWYRDRPESE
ncbi:MAG TPA: hypothetical protein VFL04_01610, partial [Rectinemataceae bacterium]|nr:hypothetical protein [Rectinemataceae bacterium]